MVRPQLDDMQDLRTRRDHTLYRLLLRACRVEKTSTLARLQELGYDDVSLTDTNLWPTSTRRGRRSPPWPAVPGSPAKRPASRSHRLNVWATSVDRRTPHDGRAVIVIQTDRGRALLGDALDVVDALEQSFEEPLGARRIVGLKAGLREVLAYADRDGALGPD